MSLESKDLRTVSSKALLGFGLVLAIGFIIAACVVSGTIKTVASDSESITVKGLAEKPVVADNARWLLTTHGSGETPTDAYAKLRQDKKKLYAFLKKQGFKKEQISAGVETSQETYKEKRDSDGNYERIFTGYVASQTITVTTKDVKLMDTAARKAFELDEMGIKIQDSQPEYLVSNLEDVKMSLIADATQNAHSRATEFAKSGNVQVGTMKSASQGAFYILAAQGNTDDSDYGGVYDKTTIDKIARVVVTINYSIKK